MADDTTKQQENEGGKDQDTGKNFTRKDFDEFSKSLPDTIAAVVAKALKGTSASNDNNTEPGDGGDDGKGDNDDKKHTTPEDKKSGDSEEVAKLKEEVNKLTAKAATSERKSELATIAKEQGLKTDGISSLLIGKDEEETKANVKALSEYLTAHDKQVKEDEGKGGNGGKGGFNPTRTGSKDANTIVKNLVEQQFGKTK